MCVPMSFFGMISHLEADPVVVRSDKAYCDGVYMVFIEILFMHGMNIISVAMVMYSPSPPRFS